MNSDLRIQRPIKKNLNNFPFDTNKLDYVVFFTPQTIFFLFLNRVSISKQTVFELLKVSNGVLKSTPFDLKTNNSENQRREKRKKKEGKRQTRDRKRRKESIEV